ncbi:MAG: aldehyde oxidase and xanthine dehydrogenase molybdopterin binding protein [Candidatus Binatus sp.]|nr:aldehyde oxidase and xanthine dehydrogenase molybdopterin binding protein [Candidatus Binatus sp.]
MGAGKLVGQSVRRVEDPRFLLGSANYVDDVKLPGTLHIAFVRSPHAHAKITKIDTETASKMPGVRRIFTGAEIAPHLKTLGLPFREEIFPKTVFRQCTWHCMAVDKVRFVGEPLVAVIAESRYLAEDAAENIEVDYEMLPAVVDPEQGMLPGATLLHEELGTNIIMRLPVNVGEVDEAFKRADLVLHDRFTTGRHAAMPMEGRATLAQINASGEMTLWTSTQMPHLVRSRIADLMNFPEQKLRVIGPDVGGGFGLKCHIFPEEVLTCYFARALRKPVKWTEDRREHLMSSLHAKDDIVYFDIAFAKDGTLLAMKGKVIGDSGAYSADPWPAPFESLHLGASLPGPYRLKNFSVEVITVCTNKSSLSTYRGVGLPGAVFVVEHTMDLAAAKLGIDPVEIRRKNLIAPDEFPYKTVMNEEYDSSSSTDALLQAVELSDYKNFKQRQQQALAKGKYIGIGISTYIEPTGLGARFWKPYGIQHSPYEAANLRIDPSGGAVLSVGTHSHGQGHATTYAQLAADQLGIEVKDISFVQGDTHMTPYGWGTWGSRSIVSGGGAVVNVAQKVREKMLRVAGHLMEVSPDDLEIEGGKVSVKGVPGKSITVKEIARTAVFSTYHMPPDEEPGLEATYYYDPPPSCYANATHVVEVEVDRETGFIKILRYSVVEDCGKQVNPVIVDAQIIGGIAQGIGMAIYEKFHYDDAGQLLTTSFMDYLVPTAADVPHIDMGHIETLSPLSAHGIKGCGEGGTIGAPAAIVNAVANALAPFNAKINDLPLTPELVWKLAHPDVAA